MKHKIFNISEEDTKDKSLDDDYDELDIKIAAETARNHNTIVDAYEVDVKSDETVRGHTTIVDDYDVNIKANEPVRDHNTIVDDYEVDNDLKTGDSRVHSLPSECESGYDETPSECDLIVGEVDGEAGNLSVHDTEDEGRGSTRGKYLNFLSLLMHIQPELLKLIRNQFKPIFVSCVFIKITINQHDNSSRSLQQLGLY